MVTRFRVILDDLTYEDWDCADIKENQGWVRCYNVDNLGFMKWEKQSIFPAHSVKVIRSIEEEE